MIGWPDHYPGKVPDIGGRINLVSACVQFSVRAAFRQVATGVAGD
jgi:hypothetical protein